MSVIQICDMVAIARYLNVTLIVPELDKTSFWADPRYARMCSSLLHYTLTASYHCRVQFRTSLQCHKIIASTWFDSEFQDIFDVDHFISSLRDEVRILKELPPRLKRRTELGMFYTMAPISWSDISYYRNQVVFVSFLLQLKSFHFPLKLLVFKVFLFLADSSSDTET